MKYFLIAGEASGDLHGAELVKSLRERDPQAEFRFLGGDLMAAAAGVVPLVHYRDMAYMGFAEVARHLRTIMGFMRTAKQAIEQWRPDAVVLIDYPSFNLKIARHAHERGIAVAYFISPKVWVWKEWRVKDIKRYVDLMLCILPFEPDFYRRHSYEATYVGNPTVGEVSRALTAMPTREAFCAAHGLDVERPIVALVPGSRVKEIRDNLPTMVAAATRHPQCQLVLAAAPGIQRSLYDQVLDGAAVPVVEQATWPLVRHSRVALVTSGTATLETAVLGTPQVACYRMGGSKWLYRFYRRLLKGDYVTLPNLITGEPVIPELLMHLCTPDAVDSHLAALLADGSERDAQLEGYRRMAARLGTDDCTATAAEMIVAHLDKRERR
ncbi:MAG: lipid-A-disaccharide synthase [Muribaculaceae bacterium]|nr:lipid-A-disaccharide synthase [Muribaculaceae bacterium]